MSNGRGGRGGTRSREDTEPSGREPPSRPGPDRAQPGASAAARALALGAGGRAADVDDAVLAGAEAGSVSTDFLEAAPDTTVSLQPEPSGGAAVSSQFYEEVPTHLDLRAALGIPIERDEAPRRRIAEPPAQRPSTPEPLEAPELIAPPTPVAAAVTRQAPPRLKTDRHGTFVLRRIDAPDEGLIRSARELIGGAILVLLLVLGTLVQRKPAATRATERAQEEVPAAVAAPAPRSWKDVHAVTFDRSQAPPPPPPVAPAPLIRVPAAPAESIPRAAMAIAETGIVPAAPVPAAPAAAQPDSAKALDPAPDPAAAEPRPADPPPAPDPAAPSAAPSPSPSPSQEPIERAATPMLSIVSRPPGALVEIDGRSVGRTPLIRPAPDGGAARLQVRLSLLGHRAWAGELRPSAAGHFNASVELQKD